MHLFYAPGFCINRMLVMLSFVSVKVEKAFFAGSDGEREWYGSCEREIGSYNF